MPFLPSPWEQAMLTYDWKSDEPTPLPLNSDMALIHPDDAVDKKLRLDISKRIGMQNRRAWGYVVNIEPADSENTRTPYEVQIMTRLVYLRPEEAVWSYVWVRITAHTSNMLVTDFETFSRRRGH